MCLGLLLLQPMLLLESVPLLLLFKGPEPIQMAPFTPLFCDECMKSHVWQLKAPSDIYATFVRWFYYDHVSLIGKHIYNM